MPRHTAQAKANRGILYVDEVNLLDDGLVDVVLDSAASGVNTVEREGISIAHPAKVGDGSARLVPAGLSNLHSNILAGHTRGAGIMARACPRPCACAARWHRQRQLGRRSAPSSLLGLLNPI